MLSAAQVTEQTKKWITSVVVGCNFCPFAAGVMKKQTVHYEVLFSSFLNESMDALLHELQRLDEDENIETSFLIFPNAFAAFEDYLDMLSLAEQLLLQNGYEGIYQVASFHPLYQFAGSQQDDAANYTNRSPYPMLHLLREESIDRALESYKDPEAIPERNIRFAEEKGLVYMRMLWEASFE
jgi:uncharacterized protein